MLSMNSARKWPRQILLILVLLLLAAWSSSYYAQWSVRWRGQHLLADVRSLNVNQSHWSDAQALIKKWGAYGSSPTACSEDACVYRITIVQVLPQFLIGYPDQGVHNWLPRLADRLGLRSAAVRAGFSVQHGIVMSKWFAEQVSLPVRAWGPQRGNYIPDLAISSGEFIAFPDVAPIVPAHPYLRVRDWHGPYGITVQTLPQEDAAERAKLMDFTTSCITQFSPCLTQSQILPEATRVLQQPN
jgi:hypothetical protein